MEKEISEKNFLNANDISSIFECSKSKSYQIIQEVNDGLRRNGLKTFSGKVLATALYKHYGLSVLLNAYEKNTGH